MFASAACSSSDCQAKPKSRWTTVYDQGVKTGIIKSEADHLRWLSIEQALVQDEFLNYNGLSEPVMRTAYKRIYDSYQPGPVLGFKHYPENFHYFYPNENPGSPKSAAYRDYLNTGGDDWRSEHSSAAPPLVPGSERFTLANTGVQEQLAFNEKVPRLGNGLPAPIAGGVIGHV
jgi:anaerobic magnesium-protoporphyrin IX monomethyl ester cyclase